eukprot:jgi/Botrbrau1/1207/Bobra.0163s0015.1
MQSSQRHSACASVSLYKIHPACRTWPFGGKAFVNGGDFRQILPVVRRGTPSDIVKACLMSSTLWDDIRVLHLHRNMRIDRLTGPSRREAILFAQWMKDVGEGKLPLHNVPGLGDGLIEIPARFCCPTQNLQDLIAQVLPGLNDFTSDAEIRDSVMSRAILAPTNEDVDALNAAVMAEFRPAEPLHEFLSHDTVDNADALTWPTGLLNAQEVSGMAPHKLHLKLGCPVILLRNMTAGLANGTRCICKAFGRRHILVEVATGPCKGKLLYLPRVKITPPDAGWPFTMTQLQFPIKPAFSMTTNKSQGQSLSFMGLYLRSPVFTHGPFHVAVSRVGDPNLIIMVVTATDSGEVLVDGVRHVYTKNIVYPQVIS